LRVGPRIIARRYSYEPSRSRVDDDWQCGQFMVALLIAQNGPANLSVNASPGKLP